MPRLQGYALRDDGAYLRLPSGRWGVRSEALNLYLCVAGPADLRWYDPAAGEYLRTHEEEAAARRRAEARVAQEAIARQVAQAEAARLRQQLRRHLDPKRT